MAARVTDTGGIAMATPRPEAMDETDVVELLIRQHSLIQDLFAQVEAAEGADRRQVWERLVRLLAVHETAEEEIVHPIARRVIERGDEIVQDRLAEENQAKQLLEQLDGMDPGNEGFMNMFRELRTSVLQHARAEERYEFSYLAAHTRPAQRRTMAAALKAAEAMAPTHPHAGVESATANVLVGTPTAIMDRVRDVIRKAASSD
jgi:hemerythrin superfamily protein